MSVEGSMSRGRPTIKCEDRSTERANNSGDENNI